MSDIPNNELPGMWDESDFLGRGEWSLDNPLEREGLIGEEEIQRSDVLTVPIEINPDLFWSALEKVQTSLFRMNLSFHRYFNISEVAEASGWKDYR